MSVPGDHERPAFDEYAGDYDGALDQGLRFTGETKDYFATGRVAWLKSRLLAQNSAPLSCLDLGCGVGGSCHSLCSGLALSRYFGYDPSTASIQEARRTLGSDSVQFTDDATSVPESEFDLIFTNGVFHHIPPEARPTAVALAYRALKPGGWFAFWENNRWNPAVHFIMSRVPFDADAQMLFPHQARSLLRQGGFSIALTDHAFFFPSFLSVLRGVEPLLCKVPLGGQYLVLAQKPGGA